MFLFQLSGLLKSENIRYTCEFLSKITGIPIFYVDADGNMLFEFSEGYMCNPAFSNSGEMLRQQLNQIDAIGGCPVFKTTQYLENFFLVGVIRDRAHIGTIFVGPSLDCGIDAGTINSMHSNDLNVPQKLKTELVHYYQTLPVIEYKKLINISILLYYIVYGEKLDSAAVIEKNAPLQNVYNDIGNAINTALSKSRQYNLHHHTPLYEKYLVQYIKEGNRDKLLDHLNKPSGGESGVLSMNPLRNQKNLFICGATVSARAAIEGGLSSELAFTISDSYIQHVEELNEVSEVMGLYLKMLCDFTDRVHNIKDHSYSKVIVKCQNYIFKNLYENISLSQLAELTGMNSNYLSELFKKEVGITISEYIQKERIEEAKKLLVLSDDSIMEICTGLNFIDQSYFTKVFRKFTGMTPKQYRHMNT